MRYLIILSLFFSISGLAASAATPQTIHQYYIAVRNRVLTESRADRETLAQAYTGNLEIARLDYKRRGDLVNTLAANQELNRFRDEQSPPDRIPENIDAKLARALAAFKSKWHEVKAEEYRRRLEINQKYATALDSLLKTLTHQDKPAEARKIEQQRAKVEDQLTALHKLLADLPEVETPPTRKGP